MKKFLTSMLCGLLISCSLLFMGCGSKQPDAIDRYSQQGYTAVCSVTYFQYETGSVPSRITTLNSYFALSFDYDKISLEEYNNSSLEYYNINSNNIEMDAKKQVYKIGQKFKTQNYSEYYLLTLTKIEEHYVFIKILDNDCLEIIDTLENHYIIKTSYFKIDFFL